MSDAESRVFGVRRTPQEASHSHDGTAELRVFGVRHHGPGSARALLAALAAYVPDCVLVEGPPDGDDLIRWLDHPALELPVALLVYCVDDPQRAVFYPFADFSPEYQALRYALAHGAEAAFMDLPRRHMLAAAVPPAMPPADIFRDLATAAGHDSYEAWWNDAIEQRRETGDVFGAVMEMAAAMRLSADRRPLTDGRQTTDDGRPLPALNLPISQAPIAGLLADAREAAMRARIRRAAAEGRRRIAAVCGAWHGPALVAALDGGGEEDDKVLRDLPARETAAAWIPWTYGRLAQASGYGAGITSPGWYDHLWRMGASAGPEGAIVWLSEVAGLLRGEGFDVSAGHVIEAVRLAEALAALRGRPFPALPELDEATQAVLCQGDAAPMALIRRRLIVGERMGLVPPEAPIAPLQRDLRQQQTRLRLRPEPEPSVLKLDLRQETHLERSRLLHRLALLDIPWGAYSGDGGWGMGTGGSIPQRGRVVAGDTSGAQELWQLQWRPELSLRVVATAMWGNTVRDAAAAFTADRAERETTLPALTALIDKAILADLPESIPAILARIETLTVVGGADVAHLLDALPPLAHVLRYGSLRHAAGHLPLLRRAFEHLLIRACLALPRACAATTTDAPALVGRLSAVTPAVALVQSPEANGQWSRTLGELADGRGIDAAVAGRATRLLHEMGATGGRLGDAALGVRLDRALSGSTVDEARYAADWLDGLLRDSGLLLVHDARLWGEVDGWLCGLPSERFVEALPLLRRTFAAYPDGVRQQLQGRTQRANAAAGDARAPAFDAAQAAAVLPVLFRLLGLAPATTEQTP